MKEITSFSRLSLLTGKYESVHVYLCDTYFHVYSKSEDSGSGFFNIFECDDRYSDCLDILYKVEVGLLTFPAIEYHFRHLLESRESEIRQLL